MKPRLWMRGGRWHCAGGVIAASGDDPRDAYGAYLWAAAVLATRALEAQMAQEMPLEGAVWH